MVVLLGFFLLNSLLSKKVLKKSNAPKNGILTQG